MNHVLGYNLEFSLWLNTSKYCGHVALLIRETCCPFPDIPGHVCLGILFCVWTDSSSLSVATNSEKSDYAYGAPTSGHITYWLFSIKFLKICKIGISLIFIYGEAKVSFESYLYDFKDLYG